MIFNSRPVHSLMLSSHCFLCLPLHLPPWTVPCMVAYMKISPIHWLLEFKPGSEEEESFYWSISLAFSLLKILDTIFFLCTKEDTFTQDHCISIFAYLCISFLFWNATYLTHPILTRTPSLWAAYMCMYTNTHMDNNLFGVFPGPRQKFVLKKHEEMYKLLTRRLWDDPSSVSNHPQDHCCESLVHWLIQCLEHIAFTCYRWLAG